MIDAPAVAGVPQSGAAHIVIAGNEGLPESGTYFPDKNNIQPRLGFAWDVWGTGRLAVRGGAGVFHNQLRNNLTLQQLLSYPFYEQPVVRDTTLENPIRPVAGPPVIGQLYTTDPNIVQPYAVVYSVGYPVAVMDSTSLEMAYVGNRGYDLLQFREMNQPIYVAGQTTSAIEGSVPALSGVFIRAAVHQLGQVRSTTDSKRPCSGASPTDFGFQVAYTLSSLEGLLLTLPLGRDKPPVRDDSTGRQQHSCRMGLLGFRCAAPVRHL